MRSRLTKDLNDDMFVKLKDLPSDLPYHIFDVLYHFDKRSNTNFCFFICRNLMIKYNLDKQEIAKKYEQTMDWPDISCIDPHSEMIYIIDHSSRWIAFNIQTNEWILDFHSAAKQTGRVQTLFFIPEPLNQVHAIWCKRQDDDLYMYHYRVNKRRSGLELLTRDLLPQVPRNMQQHWRNLKIAFDPISKQLSLMTCYEKRMFVCDIKRKNQKTFNFELCDLKFEKEIGNCIHMDGMSLSFVAWKQLYFLFNLPSRHLYCIDLLLNPQKIYRISEITPYQSSLSRFSETMKDNDNFIHLFGRRPAFHVKIALRHLIPNEIVEINRARINKLIFGYCRQNEKTKNAQYIPIYLKKLLAQFCPIFL